MARIQQRQQHQHQTTPQPWGTIEELLLACAVNRHGTKSWDSIAMEVQTRTSNFSSLTSQNCRDKFTDLKRRFLSQNGVVSSIVDQLRKIRVEELRREVQQRDVSIVSLELQVKRLEEERERSLKEEADLITEKKVSPDTFAGKSAGGNDDSGDEVDNRSFNESNSTSQQKAETTTLRERNDVVKVEENINVKLDSENRNEHDPDTVPDPGDEKDWSHNDGDNNKNKKIKANTAVKKRSEIKLSPGGLGGESNEVGESVGESKREEKEKEKQNNSDVQSSVSLSQCKNKKRRRGDGGGADRGLVGSSSGEEPEGGDEVSPATKNVPAVKSEPLVKLISIIRAHRLGFTFERRLRSQESGRYKKLIRQHIDLQTIQSRLDKGIYSSCLHKFFRDLLLLFNNAIVFFRKNSPENLAACELRSLVFKEMTEKLRTQPKPRTTLPIKPEPKQQPVSFSKLNKSSSAIVVCGKGNSVKTSENAAKKGNKREKEVEEKTEVKEEKIEEKGIRRKRTKDGSGSGSGSVSGHRNNNNNNTGSKNGEIKHRYGGNELSSHDALEIKNGKNGSAAPTRKKQGAASFLKRIKQNSPSRATENDDDDNDEDSLEEESKRGREEKTARVTRSWRGRGGREDIKGKGKRGIGRPPKKEAEAGVESGKRVMAVIGRGRDRGGDL